MRSVSVSSPSIAFRVVLMHTIRNLVSLVEHEREWNFFQGKPVLTTEAFPCDLDTTSVALTVTGRSKEVISSVMDEMLNYVDKDGIVQVSHYAISI